MDVWRNVILIVTVLGVFAYGFYLMAKLDRFFEDNQKAAEEENESCEPSDVMLTPTITEEIKK